MAYPALSVANEFITLAEGRNLSPMKLQKLVYYAHGWYLALTGKPLIQESVEAWQFGPVIRELYQEFKRYGNSDVTATAKWRDYRTLEIVEPRISDLIDDPESGFAIEVIRSIWDSYGNYSATKLSNATHKAGTPWSNTYVPGTRFSVISNDKIEEYFKAL